MRPAAAIMAFPDIESRAASLSQEFALRAAEHDEDGGFPFDNFEALRAAGLLALAVPKSLGGQGAGLDICQRVVNMIARGEASTALVLAQQYLFQSGMFRGGSWNVSLREKIARSMVEEGALANMLRVEPALGTPIRGGLPATVARRVAGGWSLSGHKIFSTGIPGLRWLGIWARTDDQEPLVGTWVVPRDAAGLRVEQTWNHLGMRATRSDDVFLNDVIVTEENAADIRPPSAWDLPDAQAAWTATLFTTVYDGIARAARDWIVDFLKERTPANLGRPLATLPRMQEAVGFIDATLLTNSILLADIGKRTDAGTPLLRHESFFMKLTVTKNAIEAVEKALEVSGNPGLDRANPLQRHYRDVLCSRVHSPQNDTILLEGGRHALGVAGDKS
jgi:alkylation response protein AidB-like acyl-CoA dehydrogenase